MRRPIASDTGPASAIETGIRLIETKKSSEATRPSMCGGTRRWSSVPQMTIGAENSAPSTKRRDDDLPDRGREAHDDERQAADAPHQVHDRQVAPRHRERRHGQRADRAADAEGRHHQGVVAGTAAEPVLDEERDRAPRAGPSSPGSSARRRAAWPAATACAPCRRSPRACRPAPSAPGGCRGLPGRRPGRRSRRTGVSGTSGQREQAAERGERGDRDRGAGREHADQHAGEAGARSPGRWSGGPCPRSR